MKGNDNTIGKTVQDELKASDSHKRLDISLDPDVEEKLRRIHAQISKNHQNSISFSQIINDALRNSLEVKRLSFTKCPDCAQEGFTVPMSVEEESLLCFLCGFETSKEENSLEKINPIGNSFEDLKDRESKQTQELLIALTNDLYEKFEKIDSKRTKSPKKRNQVEKKSFKPKNSIKEKSKVNFFGDLSWYSKKLDESTKNK